MRLQKTSEINKKIFLGGTCAESTWRDELIPLLHINYFDPRVDDWNEEAQKREIFERKNCNYCLYVITPQMEGVYSIAEVIDDSNKRPEKTIFCYLIKDNNKSFSKGQIKSLEQVSKMVQANGGKSFKTLKEIADYVNK